MAGFRCAGGPSRPQGVRQGSGVFKESPSPRPKSDLWGRPPSGGWGAECRARQGPGCSAATVCPRRPAGQGALPRPHRRLAFSPSHLCTQGLPGKRPSRASVPELLCGGRSLGALGAPPSQWLYRGRAGLGAWGSCCLSGRVRGPPMFLLVSSERCSPQGTGGGWPDATLPAQPPGCWALGRLLPGALDADSNKAVQIGRAHV